MGLLGKIISRLFSANESVTEIVLQNSGGIPQESFGLQMTVEEIAKERVFNEGVLNLLESNMIGSGYFKKEKIPVIVELLRRESPPFGRVSTKAAFKGEVFLTVEEKKALGLNTRMKYSKEFIEYFNPACFSDIEPRAELEGMHLDAFHRMSRKREHKWLQRHRL